MKRVPNWLSVAALVGGLVSQVAVAPVHAASPTVALAASSQEHVLRIPTLFGDLKLQLPVLGKAQPAQPAQTAQTAQPAPVAQNAQATQPKPAPAAAQAPAPQSNGKIIFVDPGHGGQDTGAIHGNSNSPDLTEKAANLDIGSRLTDLLRQHGYQVVMSRKTDVSTAPGQSVAADLQARVDEANAAHANLLLSVHNNGSTNQSIRGTEMWFCSDRSFSDQNVKFANLAEKAVVNNLNKAGYDTATRGTKDDQINGHYAVLAPANLDRPAQMPGIIGESLFVTNNQDAAQLQRPEVRQAIAQGYFEAIQQFFGFNS
jgi:N-acetylmuramoyl-L-alanine amidase